MENQILVTTNNQGKNITTSLIVAQVFEKDHDKVCRDIKNLACSEQFRAANFGDSYYVTQQGKSLPMYELTKDGFSFLVMGYTGAKAGEFKEKFISEFNRREALLTNDDYIISRALSVLNERTRALENQLCQKDEKLKLQEHVIKQAAPKVEYYDEVLQSESLIATNVIAKELGMSAITLNKILQQKKIIYNSAGTWVLYAKYQNKGYTGTKTHDYKDSLGNERTSIQTYWTEKGRKFIHEVIGYKIGTAKNEKKMEMQT